MKLNWNELHLQSRQEICWGACVSEKMAEKSWEELDRWLQVLLGYSIELRSKRKTQLCGDLLRALPFIWFAGICFL